MPNKKGRHPQELLITSGRIGAKAGEHLSSASLKQLVADLSLDKHILQEVLAKKP